MDTLQYRAIIHVLEVHDLTSSDSSESGGDGILGGGSNSLRPWPPDFCLYGDIDEDDNRLPSLPRWGGGASWPNAWPVSASSCSRSSPTACPSRRPGSHPRVLAMPTSMASTNGHSTMALHSVSGDGCSLPGNVHTA
jgi:hypothetical protein